MEQRIKPLHALVTLLLLVLQAVTAHAAVTADNRARYEAAEQELRSGAGPRYRALRAQLDDYPLSIYLDYQTLRERLRYTTVAEAKAWLASAAGSPLVSRFKEAWIIDHGRRGRWRALLAVQPNPPRDARLQCYYYRALYATGRRSEALAAAAGLWNVGKSQDRACDPLFKAWFGESGPDDSLTWSRALKAFDARSAQLIRYLTRFASPQLEALIQELYAVYRQPDRLLTDQHSATPRHAQLVTVGIRRLARINPEQALVAFEQQRVRQSFSDQQIQAIESMIARHSLFATSAAPAQWLSETLRRLREDELTEIYLRNRIAESDWSAVLTGLEWLSPPRRNIDQWRYWHGRALAASGEPERATEVFSVLAMERSYYGFLAADLAGLSYQLNDAGNPVVGVLPRDAGMDRVSELMHLQRLDQARGEWQALLNRSNTAERVALAQWARDAGWTAFAVTATNLSKKWDAIDWRFPYLYRNAFESAALNNSVAATELVAIARRESALYPHAMSSAGALGLMQLMPATARQVARRAGVRYRRSSLFEPEFNIEIGARYYSDLRARFGGLRPLALAAYNAGPHRVERWQRDTLPVDQWIDSLPFKETREYVRAVLAYDLVYRLREGESTTLLSEAEQTFRY